MRPSFATFPLVYRPVLPFDVILAGTNELGAATTMKIYGVEILNEGNGISVDDTVNESQATFVAPHDRALGGGAEPVQEQHQDPGAPPAGGP